jgi:DNA-binding NarL/FixJ family response regulator
MDRIRILIADDHPFFRDGLRVLMDATPDTELVGEATDGNEAVTLAVELKPDVILMDLRMPGLGGIEATRKMVEDDEDACLRHARRGSRLPAQGRGQG